MSIQLDDIRRVSDDLSRLRDDIRAASRRPDGSRDERLVDWASGLDYLLTYYLPDMERRELAEAGR